MTVRKPGFYWVRCPNWWEPDSLLDWEPAQWWVVESGEINLDGYKIRSPDGYWDLIGGAKYAPIHPNAPKKIDERRIERGTLSSIDNWLNKSDAQLRLQCGEMTAQEIRTVRAVLSAVRAQSGQSKMAPNDGMDGSFGEYGHD